MLGHILDVIKGDLLASAASLEKTRVSVAFRVIVAPCAHRDMYEVDFYINVEAGQFIP